MKISGWGGLAALLALLAGFLGCGLPPAAAETPLTAAAAQATLDGWNPSYCKVAEFHGLYKADAAGGKQVAYVSLMNPGDKGQKITVYEATFQLLTQTDGKQQWFMTSLITHGSGFLTRRQGWDNVIIPVQEPKPAKK